MATTAWSDDLSIDDSQIDFQHRQLIDAMAVLEDALADVDPQRVGETMPFLRLYAQVHFADEERVLELIRWPKLAEHRALHAGFRVKLDEFEGAVNRGDLVAGSSLLRYLSTWLRGHILEVDHEFAKQVRELRARK